MSEATKVRTRSKARADGHVVETPPLKTTRVREICANALQMHSKERKEVRIGDGCQVSLTDIEGSYIGPDGYENYTEDLDVMVWNGGRGLTDQEVTDYMKHAASVHKVPVDKSLYILHACNNDISKAKTELYGHVNLEDIWTADDDRVFWYGFQSFGKNFGKIRQLMPHKKMTSIVNHYYSTKKQQYYKSVLNDENGKANFDLSDEEEGGTKRPHVFYICKNCGRSVQKTYHVNLLEVCGACKLYFKAANEHRPVNRPQQFEKRVMCPPEMVEIAEQFAAMAKPSSSLTVNGDDDEIMLVDKPLRTVCHDEIEKTQKLIESSKAKAFILNGRNNGIDYNEYCDIKKATDLLEKISNDKASGRPRHSHTWSDFEQAAAYHCLIRFNLDYEAVAEVLGNKSTEMVRAFALENMEDIQKNLEVQNALKKDIDFDEEKPKPAPIEVIDLDDD